MNESWTVYLHKNKINDKQYVGITSQKPERRWRKGEGYTSSVYFYNAIKKYGWDNFEHIILEENLTKEQAVKKEQEYILKYNLTNDHFGYNIKEGGDSGGIGISEEGRKKISNAVKKKWQDPNYKKAQSEKAKKQWGNEEFKTLQKEKAKKQWENEEFRQRQYNQKTSKKVQCLETGDIFPSQTRAAKWCGLSCGISIARNIRGTTSYAGEKDGQKLHWRYIENEN